MTIHRERFSIRKLHQELLALQDLEYREYHCKLVPSIDEKTIIGIRIPALRKLVKTFFANTDTVAFLERLQHKYYEENIIHVWLISRMKNYEECLKETNKFLPYVDNWGVCDAFVPRIFEKHREELLPEIWNWINSDHEYTSRFGVSMLMHFYLDDAFEENHLKWVAGIESNEYYVDMMRAWYFATALAKQYEATIPYIEQKKLPPKLHVKAIQKAVESYRIDAEKKEYLKSLRL